MQTRPEGEIAKGAKVRLACDTEECFVGDLAVTSKGGRPTRAPRCPGCEHPLRPLGEIEPPVVENWGE